jgi:hypothetical protein
MRRGEAGRDDDELRGEGFELGLQVNDCEAHPDHLEQVGNLAVGTVCQHDQLGSELGKRVGDRESGHAQPEHGHPQPRPVGIPSGEAGHIIRSARHQGTRESHSR